jgi:hypothetical protein
LSEGSRTRLHFNYLGLSFAYLAKQGYTKAKEALGRSFSYGSSDDSRLALQVASSLEAGSDEVLRYSTLSSIDLTTFEALGKSRCLATTARLQKTYTRLVSLIIRIIICSKMGWSARWKNESKQYLDRRTDDRALVDSGRSLHVSQRYPWI